MRTVKIVWQTKSRKECAKKKKSLAKMTTLIGFEEWRVRSFFFFWLLKQRYWGINGKNKRLQEWYQRKDLYMQNNLGVRMEVHLWRNLLHSLTSVVTAFPFLNFQSKRYYFNYTPKSVDSVFINLTS